MGTWDDAKERQFLMAIIHIQSVSTPDWSAVAKVLADQGNEFTSNALRQKFDKMKKAAKEEFGEMPAVTNEDGTTMTPQKTPAKRGKKAGGENATKSTGKRKAGKKTAAKEDADAEESPTKKIKKEVDEGEEDGEKYPVKKSPVKKSPVKKVKAETADGEDEDDLV